MLRHLPSYLFAVVMVFFAVMAKATPTDQLLLVFDSPEQAKNNANARAIERVSANLEQKLAFKRYAGAGEIAVVKLSQKLENDKLQKVAAKLAQRFGVVVEPDHILQPNLTPNDTYYTNQWHYYEAIGGINAPAAWDQTDGNGVVVAVLDTGYRPHVDLINNILPGYDMIGDLFVANDGDGRDSDAQDPGDHVIANECGYTHNERRSSWHGTHVAGTIAASTNNSTGVAGVAYGSKILPVRVLGKCGGYSSDIIDGMRWAAGLNIFGVPTNANPAKVLNLSLGGRSSCGTAYQAAVDDVRAAGATVVVSAGNSADNAAFYTPASCNGVITVAASNRNADRAYYSNYGDSVEIAAPGGDSNGYVLSTLNDGYNTPGNDNYAGYQGTSMAAPHVAGVAALMYSKDSNISPDNVLSVMQQTARAFDSASTCAGVCGAGIVDAANALNALGTVTNPDPEPTTPAVPAGLAASLASTSLVTLNWQDVDNEFGYEVQREVYHKRGKNKGWINPTIVASVANDMTSATDQLSEDGSYRYSVRAFNSSGSSAWSTPVEVNYASTSGGGGGGSGNDKPCRGKKCK